MMGGMKINEKAVEFVTDWRKRAGKQQRTYIILSIGAFIFAFVICVLSFLWFQNRNYDRIVKQNMKYVQDSALQEANQIENKMQSAEINIVNLASQYANLIKFGEGKTVEDRLQLLCDKNLFDRIAYIAPDGLDTSLEGVANVADRNYFQEGISGNSGWELLKKSRVTGAPTVIFYSPISVDGEIVGVMAGFYEQNRLDDLFSYQLFNYVPNSYLLIGDGTVVANSNDEQATGNYLERLSQKKFIGETDYRMITDAIADENRTSITFSFSDGGRTSVGVIAQFQSSDWMVLSVLPHDVTETMVSNANRTGTILLAVISIAFLLLAVLLFYFLMKEKGRLEYEMSNAAESLEETIRKEEKQLSIIESLGDVYSSIYYIDLLSSEYQRVKELEKQSVQIPEQGMAPEGFAQYIDLFVAKADQEDLRAFLDITTFRQRLKKNITESIDYQRADGGWRRSILAPAGLGEKENITSVVFAVQRIDLEKEKELQTKKALQEAYEAAQMASNAKTAFLSNMSHDIRTPMNAIVGMTAIAAANLDNQEKVSGCLNTIASSSRHLLGLINQVLDMSKIESGQVDLCEEEFSLSDLIDNLISLHQPLIREKNHSLLVKIHNVKHEKVIGDSTRLQQVFTNLLSNAIKYSPENGRIEITLTEKENNKPSVGWYEVVFQDNGIGMSEEFQKTLFEPFARAKDSRISHIQGTGLGMSIAKNIINMMSGDISVKSEIDKGTAFTVSFALKLQTEEEVNYDKFVDLPVLVVDDDVVACESTCTMLNSLSMNSEWVTSGREAVEKTAMRHEKKEDYYAVIVDWKMPDMNGIETTREIRRRVGDDVPIIIISAYDWSDIEQEAREAGANAFLSKPLFKSRVVGVFSELVGNAREEKTDDMKEIMTQNQFAGKRILLVEDNDLNRDIAVEILGMSGLETETAENGKVGMEMFAASQPGYYDLVFMDIQMPVMNGYDATVAIRSLSHPDAKTVPIIAMSANAFSSDVRAALQSGMNGHIAKPIEMAHLIKVLNEYLGGRGSGEDRP